MRHQIECCANSNGCSSSHQVGFDDPIAEQPLPAHPDAFLLGRRDLVTDALAGHLAFELGDLGPVALK